MITTPAQRKRMLAKALGEWAGYVMRISVLTELGSRRSHRKARIESEKMYALEQSIK